jgi:energy-coupling factor transporter ATP-binding protein EcfA2
MAMKNVTIAFEGTVAVDRVSFEVDAGDYLVVVGENGSGKSTLMRAMLGLVKPRSGSIVYGDGLVVFEKIPPGVYFIKETTDANGIATYSDHNKPLYIGKYYVTEVGVPKGYVKNTNKYEFVVDDSQADVDYESRVDVENIRSKFSVKISKNDIRRTTYLKGAEFGLYAYEDILSFDGKVLVSKDEFLGKCTSGSDGKGTFKPDLCEGRYYIKELKAPEGYIMSSEAKTVILKGDEVHEYNNSTIEFANEKINEPTENKITTNAKIVKGATQSRVVKTNYRTEDNGEEGYSIVLSAADIGESAVDSRVYALALFVLVVVITSVSIAAKERVGGRKND